MQLVGEYETVDMGFVAYLSLNGIEPLRIELTRDKRTCQWVFEDGEELMEQIRLFFGGKAEVNPLDYNREFARARSSMNQFRYSHPDYAGRRGGKA